jgi:hypothetical protein
MSEIELRSIVWSHRGRYIHDGIEIDLQQLSKEEDYDSSPQSIHQLIKAGIVNFDVDVSLRPPKMNVREDESEDKVFVIAHPAMLLQEPHLPYQRVKSFLNQINSEIPFSRSNLSHHLLYPFVTLEPKFNDVSALKNLLLEILETPLGISGHVAVILKDEKFLKETIHFYSQFFLNKNKTQTHRVQPIAIAYTSQAQNLSKHEFPWRLIPPLNREQEQTTTVESSFSSLSPLLSFKLIHMPDVQLFNSLNSGGGPSERFHHLVERKAFSSHVDSSIVSWIIDTEEILWKVVVQERVSDMIITNRPIELLSQLKTHHHRICSSGSTQ